MQVDHDRPLCILLDRLFTEAEHERIAQENREKQQAEQITAGRYHLCWKNCSFDACCLRQLIYSIYRLESNRW